MAIPLPNSPKIIEQDGKRVLIEISKLYPGYGYTLGNTLRRVLYSSLPGAAITSVKIEGAAHEFSTKEGILEDLLEMSLNLKDIRLVLHGDEPQTITLKAKGKGDVTAKDIEIPSQVEIINKDAHIATLTSASASLQMEMRVEQGLGYMQAGRDEYEKKEIGVIQLDAIFTPVTLVNFEVENMRVSDRTDYNRLLLEIVTDGTIAPEDAFEEAVKLLVEHFQFISVLEGIEGKPKAKDAKTKKTSKKKATTKKNVIKTASKATKKTSVKKAVKKTTKKK